MQAPALSSGLYRKIKKSRPPPREKQNWTLGSSFLLRRFFLQHRFHNPDLSSLRTVRIRREVEHVGILPRPRGVEQIFHHDQGAFRSEERRVGKESSSIVALYDGE